MFGVCGTVLLMYRMPLLRVVLSRVVASSRNIGTCMTQRREAYPVVQAVTSTAMFNDPEMSQGCAVSWNACVLIMVARSTHPVRS